DSPSQSSSTGSNSPRRCHPSVPKWPDLPPRHRLVELRVAGLRFAREATARRRGPRRNPLLSTEQMAFENCPSNGCPRTSRRKGGLILKAVAFRVFLSYSLDAAEMA